MARAAQLCRSIPRATWCCLVWLTMTLRLWLFSLILMPPFFRIGTQYLSDKRVLRSVRFGQGSRRFLDIYRPAEAQKALEGKGPPVPVVIAFMGGGWVVGYRAWNAQFGLRLMDAGVMVVAVDYQNYPFAKIPEMIEDVDCGIGWVFANIAKYGGDPSNVILTGQSAGAHLSSMALLQRSLAEASALVEDVEVGSASLRPRRSEGEWSVTDLQGYVGVSGAYDLLLLARNLERRHLGSLLLRQLCPGGQLAEWSPRHLLESPAWQEVGSKAGELLPPVLLFHGEEDKTVPAASSVGFAAALRAAGAAKAEADVRPGLGHADIIIEGPMRGEDQQVLLMLPFLFRDATEERRKAMPPLRPTYPRWIISIASRVMPM